jgi:Cell wall hydrolyses involved in spore germination
MTEAILCLAIAIFNESKGEPTKGQYAVAEVIHNRSNHSDYPNSYCGVVKQKGQFSWYKGSQSLKPPKHENKAWDESLKVAKNFSTKKTNYTKGSLYFNHQRLGVRFGKSLKCKIGNHVFF